MTEEELKKELNDIRKNMHIFDDIIYRNYETGEGKINERQAKVVQKLLKLFKDLNWQLAFNSYKKLTYSDDEPIRKSKCGTPVKIRSCKEGHGDKTYFGILIGHIPLSIGHSIDKEGNLTTERSHYNPAIFVPELNDVILGCESFWGEIENEEDLNKLITNETIDNVWYIKMLKNMNKEEFSSEEK